MDLISVLSACTHLGPHEDDCKDNDYYHVDMPEGYNNT